MRLGTAVASVVAACLTVVGPLSAAPVLAGGAVPAYDHVFWVVESGQPASSVIGTATYLTDLANSNALATAYTAVDASSLADRLALTGGQTYGVGDCLPADCPQAGDNLATRIEASGRSWRAYAESMPSACATSASTDYAPERVPFLYYTALAAECADRVVPYTQLGTDLASAATTPSFAWISPNLQHDMSSSVSQGDSWLLANLPDILGSSAWRSSHSLLVVVFDQPGSAASLDTPVPAVMVSSDGSVRSGYQSSLGYDHYDLLSTLEASWGLAALSGNDASAAPMADVFTPQAAPPTPTAPPTSSAAPGPSPTPTAAPAPGGGPAPTAVPEPGSTPGASGSSSPAATPDSRPSGSTPSAGSTVLSPQLAAPTAGSNEFGVSTPVLDVVDLSYVGPTTISSGSVASLAVLEFTATSLTASSGSPSTPSLSLQSPCTTQNGMSIAQVASVAGTDTASFGGGVTLYVSSIDFTYLGTAYSFTAASPPASFGPVSSGQLTGVAMVAAQLRAGSTSLPSLQTVAFFQC